jgi:cysteinyl-tRNA synthetase
VAAALASATRIFDTSLSTDLGIAEALAGVFDLVTAAHRAMDHGALSAAGRETLLGTLDSFDEVLDVFRPGAAPPDEEIEALINEREEARKAKDFARADALRDRLSARGIILEDTPQGVRWKKRVGAESGA